MDLLPALASTAFASTVEMLRETAAVQNIRKKLDRRSMSSPEVCWPVPMRAIGAQNLLTMPGGVTAAGYLHKKGGSQFSLMKWPLRYIILHKGCVYYFKSSTSPAPQGAFSLNGYNRVIRAAEETTSNNVFPFKVVHFSKKHRTWLFSAASEAERRRWMRSLRREINHYNDRQECQISSDVDSDAESFYGTIEKQMDIKDPVEDAEADYVEEDDDEDDEDYLKPDGDCMPACTGRPTGPPPSYPPPPVPNVFQHHPDSCQGSPKGPPPPPVPSHCRKSTSPLPKKPLPSIPPPPLPKEPNKGPPPPPPPFAPHLQKPSHPAPPPPPPPNPVRTRQTWTSSMGGSGVDRRDWRSPSLAAFPSIPPPPAGNQPESRLVLNGPAHSSSVTAGGGPPLSNNHAKQFQSPHLHGNLKPASDSPGHSSPGRPPMPSHPPLNPGYTHRPGTPKGPPPMMKPPMPTAKTKPQGFPLQRAAPEGASFRSLGDGTESRRRAVSPKPTRADSEEDYEDMQLPDSVFIDTTETYFVEKLFREGAAEPQDGLYGIRNSGTKTSKVLVVWDVSIGKARNYRLFEEDNRVFLDCEVAFPSLSSLVEHYYNHPLPHQGSLCLQKPYTKD